MVARRGEVWWADMGPATDSAPAKRRPVLVVQSDAFNNSRIGTVIAAVITSNTRLADAPANVFLSKRDSKLPKDSAINLSQVVTLDKRSLNTWVSALDAATMESVNHGLRLTMGL